MYEKLEAIARITKTHGKNGEVVVEMLRGLPFLFEVGMELAIVPPELNHARWIEVARIAPTQKSGQLISFVGIESLDAAEYLTGKTILAKLAELPKNFPWLATEDLVGHDVFDAAGAPLGVVTEVMHSSVQDTLVIHTTGSQEFMVPLVDVFIADITETSVTLTTAAKDLLVQQSSQEAE